jgi:hypothetical protein
MLLDPKPRSRIREGKKSGSAINIGTGSLHYVMNIECLGKYSRTFNLDYKHRYSHAWGYMVYFCLNLSTVQR